MDEQELRERAFKVAAAHRLESPGDDPADPVEVVLTERGDRKMDEQAMREKALIAAAYRLNASPHEWTDKDAITMAEYVRVAVKELDRLRGQLATQTNEPMKSHTPTNVAEARMIKVVDVGGVPKISMVDREEARGKRIAIVGATLLGEGEFPHSATNLVESMLHWVPLEGKNPVAAVVLSFVAADDLESLGRAVIDFVRCGVPPTVELLKGA